MNLLPFHISLPLSIFTELSVHSVEILHKRIQCLETLSKGIYKINNFVYFKCACLDWNYMINEGTLTLYQIISRIVFNHQGKFFLGQWATIIK